MHSNERHSNERHGRHRSPEPDRLDRRKFLGTVGAGAGIAAAAALLPASAGAATAGDEEPLELPESMRAPAAAAMRTFRKIDGTPVYYWRGDRGNHHPVDWQCTRPFYNRLVDWIHDLRALSESSGYGRVEFLVSAGFYVDKPGEHGRGTAMDLDFVKWAGPRRCSPLDGDHKADTQERRRRYLAVEATLRRRFCYVLDGWYPNHQDHFHADFGDLPTLLSKDSESATNFIQATCNRFLAADLPVDGSWDAATQRQYRRMKRKLSIEGDPTSNITSYRTMLARIARHGFRNEAF